MKDITKVLEVASGRRSRQPLFKLVFSNLNLTLTSYQSSNPLAWPIIVKAGTYTGTVKPDEGKADISSLTVEVMDDARFHQALPMIRLRELAVLYVGFAGVREADWTTVLTGLVEDIPFDPETGIYQLRLNDLKYYEINAAFRSFGKSKLSAAINNAVTTIPVDSVDGTATGDSGFHDPGALPTYLLIGSEIIKVGVRDVLNQRFTGCTRGQLEAVGGQAAAAHDDNAEVIELFLIQGNPVDIALSLLTSTGAGTNGAYDLWESDQGLGIPIALIDLDKFESERDTFLDGNEYRFVLKEPISNVSSWLETEIWKTINAYPLVTGSGQISMRLYNPPFGYTPDTLDPSHAIELRGWQRGLDRLINLTQIKYDFNIVDGEFHSQRFDVQTDSANRHGLSGVWACESKGLYTDLQAESLIGYRVSRLFLRYQEGVPRFQAVVDVAKFKWDQADIVDVTTPLLPDIDSGKMGIENRLHEIVSIKPDLQKGSLDCEMWDTRLSGWTGGICPNDYPDWMSATASQRNGFYISDASGRLPDGSLGPVII